MVVPRVVRKKKSERNKKPYTPSPPCKLNDRSLIRVVTETNVSGKDRKTEAN
jgi:hypothetical protein